MHDLVALDVVDLWQGSYPLNHILLEHPGVALDVSVVDMAKACDIIRASETLLMRELDEVHVVLEQLRASLRLEHHDI